jgi:hypothetical protein
MKFIIRKVERKNEERGRNHLQYIGQRVSDTDDSMHDIQRGQLVLDTESIQLGGTQSNFACALLFLSRLHFWDIQHDFFPCTFRN